MLGWKEILGLLIVTCGYMALIFGLPALLVHQNTIAIKRRQAQQIELERKARKGRRP